MPGNFKDEDGRVQRTNGALMEAMSKLLYLGNFNKITINDLCEEAQIGRSTFYSHYEDKYDLLKHWLIKMKSVIIFQRAAYEVAEKGISSLVENNGTVIRHLLEDANSETLGLICDFMLSLLDIDKNVNGEISQKCFVLTKFCCGGIMNYLEWQVTNKSKTDFEIMNLYFYDIIDTLIKWNADHE